MTKKWLVVCVDDDEEILATVGRALRREPSFEVRTTLDHRQVLAWVQTEEVAVLVSDYEMPEITGAQLAGLVKKIRPETVRILLTGMQTLDAAIDGINQGEIFRFLQKPFDDKQLRAAVFEGTQRHEELMATSVDRERRLRRQELNASLEAEYPGITQVERTNDVYIVPDDPWAIAFEMDLFELEPGMEKP